MESRPKTAEESGFTPQDNEITPLLKVSTNDFAPHLPSPDDILARSWTEAVFENEPVTTWRHEFVLIIRSALPLVATYTLQYSITIAGVLSVGHLGKVELGAVALGAMSLNIVAFSVYSGLTTALETLCSQAYGSGVKALVGLYTQRMLAIFTVLTIPITILFLFSTSILGFMVPSQEIASQAGLYLKIVILGMPGLAIFECGKRYLQAQGLFAAPLYVMLVCAPLNGFLNWLFVWRLDWGFPGAPIAMVITYTVMAIGLFIYAYFAADSGCWEGFSRAAFTEWAPMLRLGLPGFLVIESEMIFIQILTVAAAHLSNTALAAQSVLQSLTTLMFHIPYALSVSAGVRVAILIGASDPSSARLVTRVSLAVAVTVGIIDSTFLAVLRYPLAHLFSSDSDVIRIAAHVLPICASCQIFCAVAGICNGVLRGLGRQRVGGLFMILCYYAIGLPISLGAISKLDWGLRGLWVGTAIALACMSISGMTYIRFVNLDRCVQSAARRTSVASFSLRP